MAGLCLLLAALFAPVSVRAQDAAAAAIQDSYCIAGAEPGEPVEAVLADAARWDCENANHDIGPEVSMVRWQLDRNLPLPSAIFTQRNIFSQLTLHAVDADGTIRSRSYQFEDMQNSWVEAKVQAPLPEITNDTVMVVAAFDRPTHPATLAGNFLADRDPADTKEGRDAMIWLALLSGILIMPLVFDVAFFWALRKPFLIWHGVQGVMLLMTMSMFSGMSRFVVDMPAHVVSTLNTCLTGGAIASVMLFARSIIEHDKLHPRLRQALLVVAVWSMTASVLHALFPFVLRAWQMDIYYIALLPCLLLLPMVLVDAIRRGSRAARFQCVAWMPLVATGFVRQASLFTPLLAPTEAMTMFYVACLFEVTATAVGVADRFMTIRRQRDRARAQQYALEELATRDPLTGLLNRRAIDEQFSDLHKSGFETFALVDLDHFKAINDAFGHQVGDAALKAVANALKADPGALAVRLGGEEFLLLLKGDDAAERAEQLRQSITIRIARDVEGLDRVVTASMGMVTFPHAVMPNAGFDDIYARADQLLYEAKEQGRNRSVSERLQLFRERKGTDRRNAA